MVAGVFEQSLFQPAPRLHSAHKNLPVSRESAQRFHPKCTEMNEPGPRIWLKAKGKCALARQDERRERAKGRGTDETPGEPDTPRPFGRVAATAAAHCNSPTKPAAANCKDGGSAE